MIGQAAKVANSQVGDIAQLLIKVNGTQRLGLARRTAILRYALAEGWLQADQDP